MAAEAARILVDRLPSRHAPLRIHISADVELDRLERQLLDDDRVAFHRVNRFDWEARTLDGDVGRGDSLGAAIAALATVLRG